MEGGFIAGGPQPQPTMGRKTAAAWRHQGLQQRPPRCSFPADPPSQGPGQRDKTAHSTEEDTKAQEEAVRPEVTRQVSKPTGQM